MDWIVDSFEIFKFKDESEIKIHNYDEYIIVSSNQRIWVLEPIHFGLIANLIDTINEFIPVNNGILYSFIEVGI